MAKISDFHPTVVRTERGLSIAGTRITLYDVMDYVTAGWPPKLIRDRLNLTDQQVADVLEYINTHRAAVDAVAHADDAIRAVAADSHGDAAALARVLRRVAEQIRKHLRQPAQIGVDFEELVGAP